MPKAKTLLDRLAPLLEDRIGLTYKGGLRHKMAGTKEVPAGPKFHLFERGLGDPVDKSFMVDMYSDREPIMVMHDPETSTWSVENSDRGYEFEPIEVPVDDSDLVPLADAIERQAARYYPKRLRQSRSSWNELAMPRKLTTYFGDVYDSPEQYLEMRRQSAIEGTSHWPKDEQEAYVNSAMRKAKAFVNSYKKAEAAKMKARRFTPEEVWGLPDYREVK